MELMDFHQEVARGCQYFVTNKISHRAEFAGMIIGPTLERTEVKYTKDGAVIRKYLIIPKHAFRDEIFDIAEGERGSLIHVGLDRARPFEIIENEEGDSEVLIGLESSLRIVAYTIQWKRAFDVGYRLPTTVQIAGFKMRGSSMSEEESVFPVYKTFEMEDLFLVEKIEPLRRK